ncbi:MAG: hypothetical protein ACI8P0_004931 [Planctomycetaceae bacterium]|jgi:hypothetical protein
MQGAQNMLFSKKNFSQFFSVRPRRRQAGYSVPAEVQTLQSKVLLSAVPAEVEDPTTEEDPTTAEDPTTEEGDPTTEAAEDPTTEDAEDPTTEDAEDPTTEDAEDPTTDDPSTEDVEDPTTEPDDSTMEDTSVPVFIIVDVSVVNGATTISGQFHVPEGSSPTITFGGVLAGLSATVGADGSFTVTASSNTTGVGTISLIDDDGNITDFQTVLL